MTDEYLVDRNDEIDRRILALLPGARVMEHLCYVVEEGSKLKAIRFDLPLNPQGNGQVHTPYGTFPARHITLPPGKHGGAWIVIVIWESLEEGPPELSLLGWPLKNWQTLVRLRDDMDLLRPDGTPFFK